jgi:hypothetical protein
MMMLSFLCFAPGAEWFFWFPVCLPVCVVFVPRARLMCPWGLAVCAPTSQGAVCLPCALSYMFA